MLEMRNIAAEFQAIESGDLPLLLQQDDTMLPYVVRRDGQLRGLLLAGNQHFRSGQYVSPLTLDIGVRGVPQGRNLRKPRL